MSIRRRKFLGYVGAAAAASVVSTWGCSREGPTRQRWWSRGSGDSWDEIRRRFRLDPDYIHMAGLLIASHPVDVARSIDEHRRALDESPALYLQERNRSLESAVRSAAASYLGVRTRDVALTDSTTMGIALVYNGVSVRAGQELLATTHDYFVTHQSLRFKARRSGASFRLVEPFADSARASEEEVAGRILASVGDSTRVLGLTWVHSWTGIKIPVRRIADGLADINAGRAQQDRVLLCLDGVHGLGVEDTDLPDLGCDFFMAGTHKWLFGPRGTGILWGRPNSQGAVDPTIPTFGDSGSWGGRMSPGGFKAFEHRWAVADAFDLHREIGRSAIAERIRELTQQCKEELARMRHVQLRTPLDPNLSSGIVCFDVDGMSARQVVRRLEQRNIIASVTPYDRPHARLAPGLLNNPAEVEATLEVIRAIA